MNNKINLSLSKKIILTSFLLSTSSTILAGNIGSGVYYDETQIAKLAAKTNNVGIDHGYPLIDNYVTLKSTFGLKKPVTTGRWWTPLLAEQQDALHVTDLLIPNPFRATIHENGVSLGIPTQKNYPRNDGNAGINQGNINRGYKETLDILVAIEGLTEFKPVVSDYSDWSVNVDWVANDHSLLQAIMTEGSPFVFFEKKNPQKNITLAFTNTNNASLLSAANAVSVFKTINGSDASQPRYYAIFTRPGSQALGWKDEQGNTLSANSKITTPIKLQDNNTYFSVAIIPADDDAHALSLAAKMQSYAFSFITNTSVAYQYNAKHSTVETTFKITTNNAYADSAGLSNQPLVMIYPWQLDNMNQAQKNNCLFDSCSTNEGMIATLYGNMHFFTPSASNEAHTFSFPISVTFNGVLPNLPNQLTADEIKKLNAYPFELATPADKDPHLWANNAFTDTYATGKLFGAESQLIKIANQLINIPGKNYKAIRDQHLATLKNQLTSFLTGKVQTDCPNCKKNEKAAWFFTYNNKWSTFLGFPSGFFTATTLTDHFFHYGYFLDGAATLAQFDKQWAQQYGGMINTLVRDVWDYSYDNNTSANYTLNFAHFRSFDPYAGLSSALGMPWSLDNTNEEDSAEFMNFAQSLILWGENTSGITFDGDKFTQSQQLRDLGLYLYTTEQQALSYYHFNQHPNAGVFPLNWINPETGQKNLVIGNVWSGKLDRSTYFCAGQQSCYYENLASNTFPMTPGSLYLGLDANFVLSAYKDDAKNPCSTSDNDLNKSAYCASLLKYLALGDANEAQVNFDTYFNKGKNNIDPGNTLADTYYWIANLQHLGNVNTKLFADVPTYAVFGSEANPIVSGYNGRHQPVDVHFFNADGSNRCVIANVQPGAMQTQVCKN